jgi:hypothetical protein
LPDREEACGIPNLLVAPKKAEEESSYDLYGNGNDHPAFYGDGAYYATDEQLEQSYEDAEVTHDENLTYFDSILTRFEDLQSQLSQTPPVEATEQLDKDHPTEVGPLNTTLVRWWRWKMRTVDPIPAQVACMNKGTVLRLLGILSEGNLLQRGKRIELGLSRWVWGLLARLPDRGELNSEEIGVIRALGKKAVVVGHGLKDDSTISDALDELKSSLEEDEEVGAPVEVVNHEEIDLGDDPDLAVADDVETSEDTPILLSGNTEMVSEGELTSVVTKVTTAQLLDAQEGTGPEISEVPSFSASSSNTGEDLAAAKKRMMEALSTPVQDDNATIQEEEPSEDPQWNTKATVDMILTVAGEIYGQRDLLEFRGIWVK